MNRIFRYVTLKKQVNSNNKEHAYRVCVCTLGKEEMIELQQLKVKRMQHCLYIHIYNGMRAVVGRGLFY